jgi:hypothetical protein
MWYRWVKFWSVRISLSFLKRELAPGSSDAATSSCFAAELQRRRR